VRLGEQRRDERREGESPEDPRPATSLPAPLAESQEQEEETSARNVLSTSFSPVAHATGSTCKGWIAKRPAPSVAAKRSLLPSNR